MNHFVHKSVKVLSQSKDYLCWDACARMLFLWKHPGQIAEYDRLANQYIKLERGLSRREMGLLYGNRLGFKAHSAPAKAIYGLIQRSPLIWTSSVKEKGHAMLLIGYHSGHRLVNCDPGSSLVFAESNAITPKSKTINDSKASLIGNVHFLRESDFLEKNEGNVWVGV